MSRLGNFRGERAARRDEREFRRALNDASPSLRRELDAIWMRRQDAGGSRAAG